VLGGLQLRDDGGGLFGSQAVKMQMLMLRAAYGGIVKC
jgi:hypothetical protein